MISKSLALFIYLRDHIASSFTVALFITIVLSIPRLIGSVIYDDWEHGDLTFLVNIGLLVFTVVTITSIPLTLGFVTLPALKRRMVSLKRYALVSGAFASSVLILLFIMDNPTRLFSLKSLYVIILLFCAGLIGGMCLGDYEGGSLVQSRQSLKAQVIKDLRMRYIVVYLIFFSLMGCANANDASQGDGADLTQLTIEPLNKWEAFIPPSYRLLSLARGDLNNDGLEDVAMALAYIEEENPRKEVKEKLENVEPGRPLLLLLRQADNSLSLAQRNDTAIRCVYCGGASVGDAFEDIAIKSGGVVIYHYGGTAWKWTTEVDFKYDAVRDDWVLDSVTTHTFNALAEDEGDTKVETKTSKDFGMILFSEFNIYSDLR